MAIDLEKLSEEIGSVSDKWNACFGLIKTLRFDLSKNIPSIEMTLEELNERQETIFEFLVGFELSEESSPHLLSPTMYKTLLTHAGSLNQNLDALETNLKTIKSHNGLKSFDSNTLNVVCENGQNVSVKNEIEQVNKNTEHLLTQSSAFFALVEVQYTGDLTERANKLQELYNQYKGQIESFDSAFKGLEQKIKKSDELQKKQETLVQSAEKLKADIDNIQKEAVNHQAEIKAKVGTINEIANQAETLKKRVNDYQSNFDSFDKQLMTRIETLKKADTETQAFLAKNKEREAQIDELTTKADTLIKGATVVGLANSFSESADEFKSERDGAKRAFYWSIGVLFVCTLPLAIYIFSNLSLVELPKLEFTGIITRAILLLPGIWLTKFNSRRFHIYSELHRQYSHKATVAKAIEGFKKESPEYKEQISAAAFIELHVQPEVDFGRQKKADPPSPNTPLMDLMKGIGGKLFQAKK